MSDVRARLDPAEAKAARKRAQPSWVDPMLATLTRTYFSDPDWVFEPKLDGIRCLAFKKGRTVKLLSRNKLELTPTYPAVADALAAQSSSFVLDGEVAAVKGELTSFSLLQQVHRQSVPVVYFCFDLLHLDGYDLTALPLTARKRLLSESLAFDDPLRFVSHVEEEGETYYREACRRGWEGLIAKRASSRYTRGRSKEWLKFKCSFEQELVIGGYTEPQGARSHFGALLVGYYDDDGDLRYAGKVGTGFTQRTLRDLHERMLPLEQDEPPFAGRPPVRKGAHWLKPRLVAQIAFSEWTTDGKLRHPRFLGLRTDKKPGDVVRES
ncbi:MAG TPA: non-homologous end-joining DNA ligase [Actinomycetota bacterium]|nr:non-homologous end-joining DNA ligase [Actinomycetota bacterium]